MPEVEKGKPPSVVIEVFTSPSKNELYLRRAMDNLAIFAPKVLRESVDATNAEFDLESTFTLYGANPEKIPDLIRLLEGTRFQFRILYN
ncbi:MAG: hypothetical protein WCV72_01530 [Patescibacteria group bacterium]